MTHYRRSGAVDIGGSVPYRSRMRDKAGVPLLVRAVWKIESWRGRAYLPAGRRLGSLLFYGRPLVSNAVGVVLQALIYEPALRYRCAKVGRGLRLYGRGPQIMGSGVIEIGDQVEFMPDNVLFVGLGASASAGLYIGNDVRFGPGTMIHVACQVRIGNHCRTGPGVKIYDTDMHALVADTRRQNYGTSASAAYAPVVIEDDVWIGANVVILKGVTLHRGAIVGAGAVVTRDVASHTMVAGNPARVLRSVPPGPVINAQGPSRSTGN